MSTTLEIIDSLRTEFIQEATNAPKLFKDLTKVEHYLAESYKTRSFIVHLTNMGSQMFIQPYELIFNKSITEVLDSMNTSNQKIKNHDEQPSPSMASVIKGAVPSTEQTLMSF